MQLFYLGDLAEFEVRENGILHSIQHQQEADIQPTMPADTQLQEQITEAVLQQPSATSALDVQPEPSTFTQKTPTREKSSINKCASPFRNAFFWPETVEESTKPRNKRVTPCVAVSDQYIDYLRIKQQDKGKKLTAMTTKKTVKKVKNNKASEALIENVPSSSTLAETPQPNNSTMMSNKYAIGNYVIVNFEGEYFPGEIIDIKTKEMKVKTMTMAGQFWKWPAKDDVIWYSEHEVIQLIKNPKKMNNRGQFSIPEIQNLRDKQFQI